MPIAGTRLSLNTNEGADLISQTEKVTSPYFSDGSTVLAAANLITSSQTGQSTNETYFFGIANSSTGTTQEFNVAFGSLNGHGALKETGTKSETEAIYKQYSSLLLGPTEVTGGFIISAPGASSAVAAGRDEEIFVLSARRSNMKDRINKGTWQITLSGSTSHVAGAVAPTGATVLNLKDDSGTVSPTATPAGPRYNIVSCSADGSSVLPATTKNFGFFYPDAGILVFSAAELSASIPGASGSAVNTPVTFQPGPTAGLHRGFAFSTASNADKKTALRFINCLQPNGAQLSFRDEEDQVSAQYFCRVPSLQMNFSNNPTFISGSQNELRQSTMIGNPVTFISSVQLYNDAGDMVAVGNLSTPLKKSFTSEATIKVKLTY